LAIAGYIGWIGVSSIPADTPEETFTGPIGADRTTETPGPAVPIPTNSPPRIAEPIWIPVTIGSGPGSVPVGRVSSPCTRSTGAGRTAAMLIADTELAASVSTRTGGGGGGGTGSASRGTSTNIGSASGCSSGIATSSPAIANWKIVEPTAVQRCAAETANPRDSTRLPSNIRHLHIGIGAHLRGMRPLHP
jgi:hypothetical protein